MKTTFGWGNVEENERKSESSKLCDPQDVDLSSRRVSKNIDNLKNNWGKIINIFS